MRIIAGKYRRRSLSPPAGHAARPTTDRTRESMFNLVQHRMELRGARVLDLFTGTGALGLEALSRGAESIRFVDSDPDMLELARSNALSLDPDAPCTFVRRDASRFLAEHAASSTPELYDLILADPPYDWPAIQTLPDAACVLLAPNGILVIEHDRHVQFEDDDRLETERGYGRSHVSIFRTAEAE